MLGYARSLEQFVQLSDGRDDDGRVVYYDSYFHFGLRSKVEFAPD